MENENKDKLKELEEFIKKQFEPYMGAADLDKVYHYTTLSALYSIISTGEIRLTNSVYMNDSNEYYDYINMSNKVIDLFAKEREDNESLNKLFISIETDISNSPPADFLSSDFIFSTCSEGDYIPMWINYAQSDGISLELDSEELFKNFSNSVNDKDWCSYYLCKYKENDKINIIKNCVDKYTELFKDKFDVKGLIMFRNTILKYSYLFKSQAFNYENEIRYALRVDYNNLINDLNAKKIKPHIKKYPKIRYDFNSTDKTIKPYISVKIGKLPITKIIISPKNKDETVISGITMFMRAYGYEVKREEGSPGIEVVPSTCPFR